MKRLQKGAIPFCGRFLFRQNMDNYNQEKESFGLNKEKHRIPSRLNPAYEFENYIKGECNQVAFNAGLEVATKPGQTHYNPFIIIGDIGLGKTHLANAIGTKIMESDANKRIIYVSASDLCRQYTAGNKLDFLHFYNMFDVLIIDDIQIIENIAHKTQEIFPILIDCILGHHGQVILTSTKDPDKMKGIEPRLSSRLKGGFTARLETPDEKTIIQYLLKKAQMDFDIPLSNEIANYIAKNTSTDFRGLNGVLASLKAQYSFINKPITIDLVKPKFQLQVQH